MPKKKQKNFLMRYLTPFGIRQISDIIIFILAPIMTILGMALFRTVSQNILPIGLGLFILGFTIAFLRALVVVLTAKNKRSPEYKRALVNVVLMGVLLILAIVGMILFFTVAIV